jgi:type IV pilus assembly protein PilX
VRSVRRAPARRQRGAVLFISLIVLVAMSLAGLAMMRGVDTGATIANNLAFKQGATMAGDAGIEAARTWLMGNDGGSTLYNDNPAVADGAAYHAAWQANVDFIGGDGDATNDFDWAAGSVALPADAGGNVVSYTIHRLCDAAGDPSGRICVRSSEDVAGSSGGTKGAAQFGTFAITQTSSPFYRVTVRIIGPRNTVSYVQAVIY